MIFPGNNYSYGDTSSPISETTPHKPNSKLGEVRRQMERLLQAHGKRLFVQLQEVSFVDTIVNVPAYLVEDPAFGGGADRIFYSETGDGEHLVHEGWLARRWDPAVRERLGLLLDELGREFDGRIEGLNFPESIIGFGAPRMAPADFTPEVYRDAILEIMTRAGTAFDETAVIEYANCMPGESLPEEDRGYLRSVYTHAESIGVGVGGPDLLPYRWYHQQHSLPLIRDRADGVVAGVAVQFGNYEFQHRRTGHRITVRELHVDYLFWATEEPFYTRDVLPYLRETGTP